MGNKNIVRTATISNDYRKDFIFKDGTLFRKNFMELTHSDDKKMFLKVYHITIEIPRIIFGPVDGETIILNYE